MTVDDQADLLLQEYWRGGGTDTATAKELRSLVCATPPSDAVVAGRCLSVLRTLDNPGAWATRVEDFAGHTARLVRRQHQVDQIGDVDTDPEALFEILDDAADDLDIVSFDGEALRRARVGKPSRAAAALSFLDVLGWENLPAAETEELRAAAEHLERRASRFQATALFKGPHGVGFALGVGVAADTGGNVTGYNRADPEMTAQAEAVLAQAFDHAGAQWSVEWEVPFGGASIGLSLWVGAQISRGRLPFDPLLAATGKVVAGGHVTAVDGVGDKVRAAIMCGFRRLLVPAEQRDEALDAAGDAAGVTVIPVANVADVPNALTQASAAASIGMWGTVRLIRKLLPLYELDLADERVLDNGYRVDVADAASRARLDVFSGRKATVKATGSGSALDKANRLLSERLTSTQLEPRSSITVIVPTEARRTKLISLLEREGAQQQPTTNPYETFRYRLIDGASQAGIVGYTTHKVQVQAGQAPAHDRLTDILRTVLDGIGKLPESAPVTPAATGRSDGDEAVVPHIGTDEAGKGDYFGPLVCAACYLDAEVAATLRQLGVRDSKTLSDKSIRRLAAQIRSHLPGRWSVVTIPPARYNQLYANFRREGKNLNSLVAWGHARGIKNLFDHGVWAEYAVIDKFGDERYIIERLAKDTRRGSMRLDQRTKAEADIAVAAASILARDAFVRWLEDKAAALDLPLPKGAGDIVIAAARAIVAAHGPDALNEYAKVSFKTTQKVLEPQP
jgi:ribonuclease HIII